MLHAQHKDVVTATWRIHEPAAGSYLPKKRSQSLRIKVVAELEA
jgi:hypothetical protein